MKNNFKILYILFFMLINTTNLKAVECDLEFELGDSPSKAFESLSKNEDDLISPEDMTHSYIEQDYYVVCPDEGMQNAKIQVLIKNDQIKGIKLTSITEEKDKENEQKLIYFYIKKNFGNIDEVNNISDTNWTGGEYWKSNGKRYYYDKFLKKSSSLILEELLISNDSFIKHVW
tara:strand:- start:353 stop:874 length:522 start_codon:yes stop_codon:yes gene_type:complete